MRLSCSHWDGDRWVTLTNCDESLEQIRQKSWEFTCREHGVQRGIPQEVIEIAPLEELRAPRNDPPSLAAPAPDVAQKKVPRCSERQFMQLPVVVYGWTGKTGTFQEVTETVVVNAGGAQVLLKIKLEVGDLATLLHKGSRVEQEVRVASVESRSASEWKVGLAFREPIPDFWKRTRRTPRISKTLRVAVKGGDAKGNYFIQSAYTVDISQDGARVDGVGFLTTPGQIVEIRRLWRKAKFRVVWVGQIGTAESNQIGVFGLESEKDIWHVPLPGDEAAILSKNPKPPKK